MQPISPRHGSSGVPRAKNEDELPGASVRSGEPPQPAGRLHLSHAGAAAPGHRVEPAGRSGGPVDSERLASIKEEFHRWFTRIVEPDRDYAELACQALDAAIAKPGFSPSRLDEIARYAKAGVIMEWLWVDEGYAGTIGTAHAARAKLEATKAAATALAKDPPASTTEAMRKVFARFASVAPDKKAVTDAVGRHLIGNLPELTADYLDNYPDITQEHALARADLDAELRESVFGESAGEVIAAALADFDDAAGAGANIDAVRRAIAMRVARAQFRPEYSRRISEARVEAVLMHRVVATPLHPLREMREGLEEAARECDRVSAMKAEMGPWFTAEFGLDDKRAGIAARSACDELDRQLESWITLNKRVQASAVVRARVLARQLFEIDAREIDFAERAAQQAALGVGDSASAGATRAAIEKALQPFQLIPHPAGTPAKISRRDADGWACRMKSLGKMLGIRNPAQVHALLERAVNGIDLDLRVLEPPVLDPWRVPEVIRLARGQVPISRVHTADETLIDFLPADMGLVVHVHPAQPGGYGRWKMTTGYEGWSLQIRRDEHLSELARVVSARSFGKVLADLFQEMVLSGVATRKFALEESGSREFRLVLERKHTAQGDVFTAGVEQDLVRWSRSAPDIDALKQWSAADWIKPCDVLFLREITPGPDRGYSSGAVSSQIAKLDLERLDDFSSLSRFVSDMIPRLHPKIQSDALRAAILEKGRHALVTEALEREGDDRSSNRVRAAANHLVDAARNMGLFPGTFDEWLRGHVVAEVSRAEVLPQVLEQLVGEYVAGRPTGGKDS